MSSYLSGPLIKIASSATEYVDTKGPEEFSVEEGLCSVF